MPIYSPSMTFCFGAYTYTSSLWIRETGLQALSVWGKYGSSCFGWVAPTPTRKFPSEQFAQKIRDRASHFSQCSLRVQMKVLRVVEFYIRWEGNGNHIFHVKRNNRLYDFCLEGVNPSLSPAVRIHVIRASPTDAGLRPALIFFRCRISVFAREWGSLLLQALEILARTWWAFLGALKIARRKQVFAKKTR